MCGIAGYFNRHVDAARSRRIVSWMNRAQAHRGPDHEGLYVRGPMALGHQRLSVIDVSAAAHQPLTNEDGTLWLTYNGEIYNFLELREDLLSRGHRFRSRTDAEVLLHLYEEVGEQCLQYVKGMFAFALWDQRAERLLLARDRLGKKPLHYFQFPGGLAFASELKALLVVPEFQKELSASALSRYLAFEYVPAPSTIYRDARKLLPAHYLIYEDHELSDHEYWRVRYVEQKPEPKEAYAERLRELLTRAVRRRLISDVPLGAFLSGGIDSSAIVALMAQASSSRVQTFSVQFTAQGFDESEYARRVAAQFGTDHHVTVLDSRKTQALIPRLFTALDEPFGDYTFIPTMLLSELARRSITVALSGDGGDELFAGYVTYQAHAAARLYEKLPRRVRERVVPRLLRHLPVSHSYLSLDFRLKRFAQGSAFPNPQRHYRWLGSFGPEEQRSLLAPGFVSESEREEVFDVVYEEQLRCAATDWLETLLALERRFFLQDYMLVKVDRASMAHALEVRSPFLDQDVVEFAANLPPTMKLNGLTTKYLVRRAFKGLLPSDILRRQKHGFAVPIARWIAGELKPLILATLASRKLAKEGFFRPEYVRRLLAEHFARKANHYKEIWTLFMFELWLEQYRPSRPVRSWDRAAAAPLGQEAGYAAAGG